MQFSIKFQGCINIRIRFVDAHPKMERRNTMKVLPAVRLAVWIGAVSIILLIACQPDGPNMSQVVIDGTPLAQVSVVFSPESGERSASGTTDDNVGFDSVLSESTMVQLSENITRQSLPVARVWHHPVGTG